MPSVQEMTADLQAADAAGDTQLAQHIAGLIKAQGGLPTQAPPARQPPPVQRAPAPMTRDQTGLGPEVGVNTPLGRISSDQVTAAAENFGHNMLGAGDVVGALGRMVAQGVHGQPVDYQTAAKQYANQRNYLSAQHPVSSVVGGVAGALDTGLLGGAVVKGAGLISPVSNALATTEGQVVQNLGKLAIAGGAAGAAQGGAQGAGEAAAAGQSPGQVLAAGAKGAIGGGVTGAVLGPAVGTVVPAAAKVVAPLATKTAANLAKLMGTSADEVSALWTQFSRSTGRAPSMAELAGLKAQANIKAAAKAQPAIGERLVTAQDTADQARVASMQGQVAPPAPTGKQDVLNATTAEGDVNYPAARAHDFSVPTEADPNLGDISPADHLAAQVLPQAGLKTADMVRIRAALRDGTLSGQDAQLIQSGLGKAQTRAYSPAVASAQADLEDFLSGPGNEAANAALQHATARFAAGRAAAEGNALGQKAVTADNTPEVLGELRGATDAQAVAVPQGATTALHTAAQTPAGATALAHQLATDTGLHTRLTATLGEDTANALRDMGQREADAADALASVTPRTPPPESDSAAKVIQTGIHGLAAVASHGIWFKAMHAAKVLTGTGMSDAVAQRVAGYLADPAMTAQGIALLRKAGADNAALRRMTLTTAASTGLLTGTAAGDIAGQ